MKIYFSFVSSECYMCAVKASQVQLLTFITLVSITLDNACEVIAPCRFSGLCISFILYTVYGLYNHIM